MGASFFTAEIETFFGMTYLTVNLEGGKRKTRCPFGSLLPPFLNADCIVGFAGMVRSWGRDGVTRPKEGPFNVGKLDPTLRHELAPLCAILSLC